MSDFFVILWQKCGGAAAKARHTGPQLRRRRGILNLNCDKGAAYGTITEIEMDKEEFERRRQYAGAAKPSMLRRMVGHDYRSRQIYLVTMVTEGRRRLFGDVAGRSDADEDSPERPRMELSPLGEAVEHELLGIPRYYPQIKVLAVQMMPDHVHGILFVQEELPRPLGQVIKGFKTGCNRLYRELCGGVRYAATSRCPVSRVCSLPRGSTTACSCVKASWTTGSAICGKTRNDCWRAASCPTCSGCGAT